MASHPRCMRGRFMLRTTSRGRPACTIPAISFYSKWTTLVLSTGITTGSLHFMLMTSNFAVSHRAESMAAARHGWTDLDGFVRSVTDRSTSRRSFRSWPSMILTDGQSSSGSVASRTQNWVRARARLSFATILFTSPNGSLIIFPTLRC